MSRGWSIGCSRSICRGPEYFYGIAIRTRHVADQNCKITGNRLRHRKCSSYDLTVLGGCIVQGCGADRIKDRQNRDLSNRQNSSIGERAGASASPRQLDNSTYRSLERDRATRAEGAQRTRDRGSYNRSGGSAGSYRGGGFSRGGGGFRGGGRRR